MTAEAATMTVGSKADLLYPLSHFYAKTGRPAPRLEAIDGDRMPEPYRALLVHDGDMTSTLEKHHRTTLRLRRWAGERRDDAMLRLVTLVSDFDDTITEFGAIRIDLTPFEADARRHVIACRRPLGAILRQYEMQTTSEPDAYFRLTCDELLQQVFRLPEPCDVYGRRNLLLLPSGRTLAQVVEVLPPMKSG